MLADGVVMPKRVAREGARVPASARAASLRRSATLEECHQEARTQIEQLKRQIDEAPSALVRRRQATRERERRIARALARLPEMVEVRGPRQKGCVPANPHQASDSR